jgi:hypothetical protein
MKTYAELRKLCIQDEDLMRCMKKHLNLIKIVNENYDHIQDLEVLVKLFKNGASSYEKEYYPLNNEVVLFCAIVAENTRANHYRKEEEKFDDIYTFINDLKD